MKIVIWNGIMACEPDPNLISPYCLRLEGPVDRSQRREDRRGGGRKTKGSEKGEQKNGPADLSLGKG